MLQRVVSIALAIATFQALQPSQQPTKFSDIFRQYQTGDFDVVARTIRTPDDLARIQNDLDAAVKTWSSGAMGGGSPLWRPIQVSFLLEIAISALTNDWPLHGAEIALRRAETFLTKGPGKPRFESLFFLVDVALIEATMSPDSIEHMVGVAVDRLGRPGNTPEEQRVAARLELARAFVAELHSRPQQAGIDLASGSLDRMTFDDVIQKYEIARRFPQNATESVIREGFLHYRAGQYVQALSLLESLSSVEDDELAYWRQLFLARTLVAAGRPAAGRDAYLAARALAPDAQSPLIGLAGLDFTQGDRSAALAWSVQARTLPSDAVDPWWDYWRGDARFLDEWLADFREASRR